MSKPTWSFEGLHFANCNCDYGCPCQFNALPTDGTCKAVVAWQINKGYCGDIKLDGLKVATTYAWNNPIHQGNGEMQVIVDDSATEEQRRALVGIMNGEYTDPGKIMIQIYRSMCSKVHDPIFAHIDMDINMEERYIAECLNSIGISFLFAQRLHPAMKNVAPVAEFDDPVHDANGKFFTAYRTVSRMIIKNIVKEILPINKI